MVQVTDAVFFILLLLQQVVLPLHAFVPPRHPYLSRTSDHYKSLSGTQSTCARYHIAVGVKGNVVIDQDKVLEGEDYALEVYQGDLIERYYDKRPFQVWERLVDIGSPVFTWWLACKYDNLTASFRSKEEQEQLIKIRAAELKDAIVQGKSVTFIKSGQALALRPDLLKSPPYVEELQKLQDEVGVFDNEIAMKIIEEDLGKSPHEMFEFDPITPIASASIGQVYRARLKATNQIVAIKVQRPDSLQTVPLDMYILRKLAKYWKEKRKLRSNLIGIVDGFGGQLYQELNYIQEAKNCKKFKRLYGQIPGIYVPDIFDEYTSKRVLTMEFVEGVKGPWKTGGERMLTIGLQCSVLQLLGTGFFHSDPHRGNLLQTPTGELAYLDFGMMNEIPSEQRYAMIGVILGLVNQDLALTIRSMETLEFFVPGTNVTNVITALKAAVKNATSSSDPTATVRTSSSLTSASSNLNFTRLNENIIQIQNQLPIQLPPFYTMIIRSLTILEGLALYVDKDFRLIKGAYPFVAKQILSNPSPELNRLLRNILLNDEGKIRWDKLESLISIAASARDAVEKGDFQALKQAQDRSDFMKQYRRQKTEEVQREETQNVVVDTNVGQQNMNIEIVGQILDYLLSENGQYLREPLIDEIIETLEEFGLTAQRIISIFTLGIIPSPKQQPDREKVLRVFNLLGLAINSNLDNVPKKPRGIILQNIVNWIQTHPSLALEEFQPIFSKLSLLLRQVVGKVVEKNTNKIVHNLFTPKLVEGLLPIVAGALELLPVDIIASALDIVSKKEDDDQQTSPSQDRESVFQSAKVDNFVA